MISLWSVEFLLLIAVSLVFIGGALAIYLKSEGILSAPQLYILLSSAIILLTLLSAGTITWNAEKIEYTVSQCPEGGIDGGPDNRTANPGTNFSELSPEAQEVFRSALQADDVYTTHRHPDEFALEPETDAFDEGVDNFIQYESECYDLTAQRKDPPTTVFWVTLVGVVGSSLAIGFAIAGLVGYKRQRRQRWVESDSLEESQSKRCPNCNLYIGTDPDECRRCGWSSTDEET